MEMVVARLILQVDRAIDLIFAKYFKFLIDYKGIQRVETPMLSRDMVREILLNAVNHKDYASGVPIQVAIYDDHIDVFNMGNWPERVPSDQTIYERHESVPHNPKVANVSFGYSAMTIAELSVALKVSKKTVSKYLKNLKEKSIIERIGSDRKGNRKLYDNRIGNHVLYRVTPMFDRENRKSSSIFIVQGCVWVYNMSKR